MSDWQLLRQYVQTGSQEAFRALVQAHLPMVYSTARREVHDAHLAEDVAQAVFLVLARKAHSLKPPLMLGGWLFRVTRYAAARARAKEQRQKHHEQEAGQMRPQMQPEQVERVWEQIEPKLNAAIGRLKSKDREAIVLRYMEDRSLREVAEAIGVSEAAAKMRIGRALEKLRGLLKGKAGALSGAGLGTVLVAKAAEAAPAHLRQIVSGTALSAGSAAAVSGSVMAIAKGAVTMLAWAKMKMAAACSLVILLGGIAAALALEAVGTGPAGTGGAQPTDGAAQVMAATAPTTGGYQQLQLVRWQALVNDALAAKIRASGKPIDSASKGFQAYRCDAEVVQALVRQAQGTKDLLHLPDFSMLRMEEFDRIIWETSRRWPGHSVSGASSLWGDDGHEYSVSMMGSGLLGVEPHHGFLRLLVDYKDLTVLRSAPNLPQETQQLSMQFAGDLKAGEAIVFVAGAGKVGSVDVTRLLVWQAFSASAAEMEYVPVKSGAESWLAKGPAGMVTQADEGIAWARRGVNPEEAGGEGWTRKLEHGGSVRLVAVGQMSVQPFRWWDGDGEAVAIPAEWIDHTPDNGWSASLAITDSAAGKVDYHTGGYVAFVDPPDQRAERWTANYAMIPLGQEGASVPEVKVGLGSGPWRELGRMVPGQELAVDGVRYRLAVREMNRKSGTIPGTIRVELARDEQENLEVTIGVVDKSGHQRFRDALPQLLQSPPRRKVTDSASSKPVVIDIDDVDHYVLLARPRVWVTFAGIAPSVQHFADGEPAMARPRQPVAPTSRPVTGTPEAWAYGLAEAIERNDVEAAKAAIYAPAPLLRRYGDAAAELSVEGEKLRRLATDRYGIEAVARVLVKALPIADLDLLRGMRYEIEQGEARPIGGSHLLVADHLVRIGGEWKLDLQRSPRDHEADMQADLRSAEAMVALVEQAIRDVQAGKYDNIEDLRDALRDRGGIDEESLEADPATQSAWRDEESEALRALSTEELTRRIGYARLHANAEPPGKFSDKGAFIDGQVLDDASNKWDRGRPDDRLSIYMMRSRGGSAALAGYPTAAVLWPKSACDQMRTMAAR